MEITQSLVARAAFTRLPDNDANASTVIDYLRTLLSTLWEEEEGFDGKRPFGNSSWQSDVHAALIDAGVVAGELDADGYIIEGDTDFADRLIQALINDLTID